MTNAIQLRWVLPLLACTQCVEPNPNLGPSTDPSTTTQSGTTGGSAESPSSEGPSTTTTSTTSDEAASGESSASLTDTGTGTGGPSRCAGPSRACVSVAPGSWSGPGAVAQGDNTGDAPTCPESFEAKGTLAYDNLVAPPAQCQCSCDPINPGCADPVLSFDSGVACDSPQDEALSTKGICGGFISAIDAYYFAQPPAVISGACGADPSSETPPAEFGMRATLCAATPFDTEEACPTGEVCAAIPDAPFDVHACIWIAADLPCPAGSPYEVRTMLHQGIADTRGCTACECGPIGGTCSATIEVYDEQLCSGAVFGQVQTGAPCEQIVGAASSAAVIGIQADAACGVPSGAQPAGSAAPEDPLTVCCTAD